jgi:hypothetical protein
MGLRESIARALSGQLRLRVAKLGKGKIGNERSVKHGSMGHDGFNESGTLKSERTAAGLSGMHMEGTQGDPDAYAHTFRKIIKNKKINQSARTPGEGHSTKHLGFKSVQNKIAREGYSSKIAGAILASRTRAAHHSNPRLARVKG